MAKGAGKAVHPWIVTSWTTYSAAPRYRVVSVSEAGGPTHSAPKATLALYQAAGIRQDDLACRYELQYLADSPVVSGQDTALPTRG
ncbi:hypothetical protein CCHOA_05965 [Corynebacterium choanae]|uniref:Uncharacterized protein n=1 Tax=Corynebacterium choanae TaxID=1862358 RepID=A0A3G6J6Z4_9CORY|nr:hypothetical protein CCHOA_05965 [Corynebacterium choanae]